MLIFVLIKIKLIFITITPLIFVSDQPSQPIDCLLIGEFSTITKNAPINILTDKSGALLYNMLKAADLFSYDLCFLDIQVFQSVKKVEPFTLKTDRYSNSLRSTSANISKSYICNRSEGDWAFDQLCNFGGYRSTKTACY